MIIESGGGYSLEDLCEIANFDFFANPFIPGQPIKYYEKFLKPIHDVLAALKYVYHTSFTHILDNHVSYFANLTEPVDSASELVSNAARSNGTRRTYTTYFGYLMRWTYDKDEGKVLWDSLTYRMSKHLKTNFPVNPGVKYKVYLVQSEARK